MAEYGLEGQIDQHERDAESLVMEYGISLGTARQAVHRLGLSGTVVVLHAVAKDDPAYIEFDNAFPRIERMIPPIRRAIRHFSGTGLGSGQVIDLVMAYGDAIYRPDFSLELALENSHARTFLERDLANMSVEGALERVDDGAVRRESEDCPYAGNKQECHVYDCPRNEIPMTCLGDYKPLLNLLGLSEVRENDTIGKDESTSHMRTLFEKQ
jgi:hypothetical protein